MTDHVVVVGAGPAGRACAAQLAEAGRAVTIIERHQIPGTKACAGGIPCSAWGAARLDRFDHVVLARHHSLHVRGPLGSTRIGQSEPFLAVVDRPAWAAAQLEQLKKQGVRLVLGTRVLALTKSGLATSQGALDCDIVVGADGSASRIRRLLGLGPSRMRVSAFQITAENIPGRLACPTDHPTVWFDPRRFAGGYGWCFPAGNALRIGCCARHDERAPKRLRSSFIDWLSGLLGDATPPEVRGASISCSYVGHRFGRIYLAGDAAGLASPLTGEGIAQSILSGREVAREILNDGYCSPAISNLARQHRRTCAGLHLRTLGAPAYLLAPGLLRWPSIRNFVWKKYVC